MDAIELGEDVTLLAACVLADGLQHDRDRSVHKIRPLAGGSMPFKMTGRWC
jgi:hypothetical protein